MKAGFLPGLLSAALLAGCATHDVVERIGFAERIAAQQGFTRTEIKTGGFDLVAYLGPRKGRDVLHVYIEGDGFAWLTHRQPSRNPTPLNPVALKLAVLDDRDTAYLARPCQYAAVFRDVCRESYWTFARFAPAVILAMDEAITRLKLESGAQKLVLIGYSGGGAVAALVAARRADVAYLVTVAGNLDPVAWTRLHGIAGLDGSLNPADQAGALAGIRQTHFVGGKDRVIPVEIYRSYRAKFSGSANITVEVVPGVDHDCCWEDVWRGFLEEFP